MMTPETNITEHAAALLDECGWDLARTYQLARRNFYIITSHFPPATGSKHGEPGPNRFDEAFACCQELSAEIRRLHDERMAEFRRRYVDPMKAS